MERRSEMARQYQGNRLVESELGNGPATLCRQWLAGAVAAGEPEPTAMTLATVGEDGAPSARIVLLKEVGDTGLVFFTNYESRKARELAVRPVAAATLYWPTLNRQVRVEGPVEKVAARESDAYFATRPRGSQLGAWASPQSREIADRESLERTVEELEASYRDRDIPRPAHWGGYRLAARRWEFWQGQPDRLHDRLLCEPDGDGWRVVRLGP